MSAARGTEAEPWRNECWPCVLGDTGGRNHTTGHPVPSKRGGARGKKEAAKAKEEERGQQQQQQPHPGVRLGYQRTGSSTLVAALPQQQVQKEARRKEG